MNDVITLGFGENLVGTLADFLMRENRGPKNDFSRTAVVFGGKRPALFLKRELARRRKTAFYPPVCFSMDEFMAYLADKEKARRPLSELEACYYLFILAREHVPELTRGRERFAQFLPWAREIMEFIEQLDLEDIPGTRLKSVEKNADIGYDVPENVNVLLRNITVLRERYHALLGKHGFTARGFTYLSAARLMETAELPEFDCVIFGNLFSPHAAEKAVIRGIYRRGKAVLFFQKDDRQWAQLEELADCFKVKITRPESPAQPYQLRLYAGFDVNSQAGIVREIVRNIPAPDKTVIIMPEPANLMVLLSEISAYSAEYNVSMGYPVKRSAVSGLLGAIMNAQAVKKDNAYYARDYLAVLRHPLMKNLRFAGDPVVTRTIVHKIEEILTGAIETPLSGSLFVKPEETGSMPDLYRLVWEQLAHMNMAVNESALRTVLERLHYYGFKIWESLEDCAGLAAALKEFFGVLTEKSFPELYPLNLNIMRKLRLMLDELEGRVFSREKFGRDDLFRIFTDMLEAVKISFSGTPLKGLQILGLFESRSLNFENVIIMDVNESVLPRLRVSEPLIPRQVMISLGLNRLETEEAIQRYHFLRLIRGAKQVHLVYDDNPDKQRSRFVEELIWEGEKQDKIPNVSCVPRARFTCEVLPGKKIIAKSAAVRERLRDFCFSASGINTYLNCPAQFYYQYMLGAAEKEDLRDEPESRDIGTFVHSLLEDTFSRFIGEKPRLDEKFAGQFFAEFHKRFAETFVRRMRSDAFMLEHIIEHRLRRFLRRERERIPEETDKIIGLEQELKTQISLGGEAVRLKCRVDRVDKAPDASLLVLDYKTGGTDALPGGLKTLEKMNPERESILAAVRSFQLPVYVHVIRQYYPETEVNAALYNLRKTELKFFPKEKERVCREQIMEHCLRALEYIIAEIRDPAVPFMPSADTRACEYCSFFYLCR